MTATYVSQYFHSCELIASASAERCHENVQKSASSEVAVLQLWEDYVKYSMVAMALER